MKQQSSSMATALTYLGSIPFLLGAYIALSSQVSLPEFLGGQIAYPEFKARALMHTYAVVILSFLAGIHWGISLHSHKPNKLLIISTILAIVAWLSLAAFATKLALSILLIGFILVLITDRYAHINLLIPKWFWQLRKKISVLVIATLIVVLLAT